MVVSVAFIVVEFVPRLASTITSVHENVVLKFDTALNEKSGVLSLVAVPLAGESRVMFVKEAKAMEEKTIRAKENARSVQGNNIFFITTTIEFTNIRFIPSL